MIEKGKTYVVVCRRGLNRDTCPAVQQEGAHCVECPYAGYMLREQKENNETETEEEKSEDAES